MFKLDLDPIGDKDILDQQRFRDQLIRQSKQTEAKPVDDSYQINPDFILCFED